MSSGDDACNGEGRLMVDSGARGKDEEGVANHAIKDVKFLKSLQKTVTTPHLGGKYLQLCVSQCKKNHALSRKKCF